jgi:hypothetical protein
VPDSHLGRLAKTVAVLVAIAVLGGAVVVLARMLTGPAEHAAPPSPQPAPTPTEPPPAHTEPAPPPATTTPAPPEPPPPETPSPQPLPPSPEPSPSLWNQAGVFVWNTNAFDPRQLIAGLGSKHFAWVAFNAHDGLTTTPIDPAFVRLVREAGFVTGAWGVQRDQPVDEAALAVRLVQEWGFRFYIADAEDAYKADAGGVLARSQEFVDAFRARAPNLPAALSTYGAAPAPHVLPIDFAAWRRGGFHLLPQAYYNESEIYRPDETVAHASRAGWPRSHVHPVVGVYRRYPAEAYLPLLEAAESYGFSVYLADQMTDADYVALRRGIEQGLAEPR